MPSYTASGDRAIRQPFTRADYDRIAELVAAGWSNTEIAKAMAAGPHRVRYAVRKMGLSCAKRRRPSKWTVEWAEAIIRGTVALPRGSSRARRRAELMLAEA